MEKILQTPSRISINVIRGQKVVDFARLYLKMPFANAQGIGFEENGYILGGVIFDDFKNDVYGKLQSCEASVIALDKRWISRYTLKEIYKYSFSDLGIRRLCLRCGRSEKKKRDLILRLGFKFEGISREAWPYGGDASVFSMLKSECEYLDGFKPLTSSRSRSNSNSAGANL